MIFFGGKKWNSYILGPNTNSVNIFEVASSSKHPQKLVNATKVARTSNFSFPAKNVNFIFLHPKSRFQHIFCSSEFCLIAKLLESKDATNKSYPDRSPLPPVKSISPDFDFDIRKIFWGSPRNVKSQKKCVTVPPGYYTEGRPKTHLQRAALGRSPMLRVFLTIQSKYSGQVDQNLFLAGWGNKQKKSP